MHTHTQCAPGQSLKNQLICAEHVCTLHFSIEIQFSLHNFAKVQWVSLCVCVCVCVCGGGGGGGGMVVCVAYLTS